MDNRLKPYEQYTESEVSYINSYPSHWETTKLRFVFAERKEKNTAEKETNILSVMKNRGVIPYSEKGNVGNKHSEDIERYKLVYEDDIVMNSMNVIIGSVGRSKYNGTLSPVYYVLKNRNNLNYNTKYFENIFRMTSLQRELTKYGKGILAHRMRIPFELLKNIDLPLPPKEEQDQIVRYLDWKLLKINKFIKAKKRQINLLKEQKQVIISQAVTKGIDPNVKMKPSGIEWLGNIPEGWEANKLGYIGKCQNGISEAGSFFESGHPFVSYGDIYKDIQLPFKVNGVANSNIQQQDVYSVKCGDVFFTRTSETIEEIGLSSTCLQTIDKATFSGFVIRFRPNDNKFDKGFSKYYFRNNKVREYFTREMNIVTRASLSQTLLRNMPIVLPTLIEQEKISKYLDIKTQRIDSIIEKIEKEINLITEYRTSLISDVVTGKVDVRSIFVENISDVIEETEELEEIEETNGIEDIEETEG